MKNKYGVLLLLFITLLVIFSDNKPLSITSAIFMLPIMLLLTTKNNWLSIILPPLLWNSVLLYPIFLMNYADHNLLIAVSFYLFINFILSVPLYALLITYRTEKFRLVSPLAYLLTLFLLKNIIFQTIPVIMIFQSSWLRYFASFSVSVWLTTLILLYFQLYIAEIIRSKSYQKTQKYLLCIIICFLVNIILPSKKLSDHKNINILGIPLSIALGDSADLHDIVKIMEQGLKNAPDTNLVIFSESSWLGFKQGNNKSFTDFLLHYLIKKSLTDNRIYLLQTDGLIYAGEQTNKVLTVKIENGKIWYTGKKNLVPGWETPFFPSARQALTDNYFNPEPNKLTFTFQELKIRPEICYEVLFMPSLHRTTEDLVIVQSSYILFYQQAGKSAYDHIVRVSNLLGWFSHSANHQAYINIQNQGGSEIISSTGKREILFFNHPNNKQGLITTQIQ